MIVPKIEFIPKVDLEIARTKGVTKRAHRASLMFASDSEKASGEEIKVALLSQKISSAQV